MCRDWICFWRYAIVSHRETKETFTFHIPSIFRALFPLSNMFDQGQDFLTLKDLLKNPSKAFCHICAPSFGLCGFGTRQVNYRSDLSRPDCGSPNIYDQCSVYGERVMLIKCAVTLYTWNDPVLEFLLGWSDLWGLTVLIYHIQDSRNWLHETKVHAGILYSHWLSPLKV